MERPTTPGLGVNPPKNRRIPPAKQNVAPCTNLSFAERKAQLSRRSKSNIVEGNSVLRSIERPPPGDVMGRRKSQLEPELAKRRSAFYESEFAVGREIDPTKDRVRNDAIVLAELRTNVIIQDEFTFITDLSYHLSNRYQRSVSSIVINLQHGCCMMFGGSFDPAYTLTIFALPSLVQPITNKRNAALIQAHMMETLGVVPSRGYLRFVSTPEEDVAICGKTVAGEMEDLERETRDETGNERDAAKLSTKNRKLSVRSSWANFRPSTAGTLVSEPLPTPPASTDDTPMIATSIPEHPPTPEEEGPVDEKAAKTAARRKSFVSALLFGNRGSTKDRRPKTSMGF
ncbi:uncharacterized protein JN550_010883 [Neoarthrinium moseri]|uniref:uncharacterized protein n=1 Tax=Neoarthrinium moseri TaxID=1658444 RepID=UPI001FDE193C|nr:uncharacterized protein JN550_010883 [Neoarthrinium moseri]KAI1861353.1 hypothetical protein JN550_010883 [Neoarthrinium moseri]